MKSKTIFFYSFQKSSSLLNFDQREADFTKIQLTK